jgi:hypothetical protein
VVQPSSTADRRQSPRPGPYASRTSRWPVVATGPPHLPPPVPIVPLASPAIAGEGQWSPVGRLVGGVPAIYETTLRPDAIHTSYVVGVAWMDTKLLKATLYSGSQIPGGGPYTYTAPVQPGVADSLVAAFNAGFLMSDANGGYYTQGKSVLPLRAGAASFVIYRNGSATVGEWGRDVTMTPNVVSVRQNLDLLVDGGKPVPGLNAADTTQWGNTLGNAGLCLALGHRGHRRRCPRLRGRTGAQRHRPGQSAGEGGRHAGHGARHQYRLGQLLGVRPGHAERAGVGSQRHRAASWNDGDPGPVLPVLVGSGLHHDVRRGEVLR